MTAGGPPGWSSGPMPVVEPEYLASLLSATSDLVFVLAPDGEIRSVLLDSNSKEHPRVSEWSGKNMRAYLTIESIPKLEFALKQIAETGVLSKLVELNHRDDTAWQYPARYSFHKVGPNGSILMLGKDLRSVAETQAQLVQAQIALERGYEERREHDARYRILMAHAREAFVFITADGRIRDANAAAARLLSCALEDLVAAPISKAFRYRQRGEFLDALMNAANADFDRDMTVQATQSKRDLIIKPSVFRSAGEKMIFCRITKPSEVSEGNDRVLHDLDTLYRKSPDAIVICDPDGIISNSNEAFLELCGAAGVADVLGRSMSNFLQRSQVDLNIMLENVKRAGYMRVYATRLANAVGESTSVEISSTRLGDLGPSAIGFVIRNAEHASALRGVSQAADQPEAQNQHVIELVGSASLREILTETSDVIEKLCIETAVDLTGNNRAAAAYMLGVSRQSLYVKLRKYGLLKREDP